ncbi:hypothetical protein NECAME_15354 [Necator americanus]|uniref:Uncharacterized protein n=1 Tax=Necator americanus TaxID=51031 RepID=W2SIG9_NECAM|nr:hypothetical protein NECAME_15354 [Necator americanus]ETN69370.1 hypothetical protein NECAME_15354 [Necator americanus]
MSKKKPAGIQGSFKEKLPQSAEGEEARTFSKVKHARSTKLFSSKRNERTAAKNPGITKMSGLRFVTKHCYRAK